MPVVVSFNSAADIKSASSYWKAFAITAILFLGNVAFCGWWYQRRLRGVFRMLVDGLGKMEVEREDIRAVVSRRAREAGARVDV